MSYAQDWLQFQTLAAERQNAADIDTIQQEIDGGGTAVSWSANPALQNVNMSTYSVTNCAGLAGEDTVTVQGDALNITATAGLIAIKSTAGITLSGDNGATTVTVSNTGLDASSITGVGTISNTVAPLQIGGTELGLASSTGAVQITGAANVSISGDGGATSATMSGTGLDVAALTSVQTINGLAVPAQFPGIPQNAILTSNYSYFGQNCLLMVANTDPTYRLALDPVGGGTVGGNTVMIWNNVNATNAIFNVVDQAGTNVDTILPADEAIHLYVYLGVSSATPPISYWKKVF
jgi:hypothetical protein